MAVNDGKFCLWDPSSHPYLFAFQAVPRLPRLLALCMSVLVLLLVPPSMALSPAIEHLSRQSQAWFREQDGPKMVLFGTVGEITLSWGGRKFSQVEANLDVPANRP